ncbi:MAG: hypothetical protein ABFS56_24750 [Pseudomonadota bacterium]
MLFSFFSMRCSARILAKSSQEKLIERLQHQLYEQNANAMQALQAGNFAQASQIASQLEHLQKMPQRLDATQAHSSTLVGVFGAFSTLGGFVEFSTQSGAYGNWCLALGISMNLWINVKEHLYSQH